MRDEIYSKRVHSSLCQPSSWNNHLCVVKMLSCFLYTTTSSSVHVIALLHTDNCFIRRTVLLVIYVVLCDTFQKHLLPSLLNKTKFWLNKNCLSLSTNRRVRKHEVYKLYLMKIYFLTPISVKVNKFDSMFLIWFFKLYIYWSGANLKLLFNIEIHLTLEQTKNIPCTQKEHWKFQIL